MRKVGRRRRPPAFGASIPGRGEPLRRPGDAPRAGGAENQPPFWARMTLKPSPIVIPGLKT
ncbi:hypothetical protein M885DRAFT_536280, partial [Pelagophyceae sp. CCMP2097]